MRSCDQCPEQATCAYSFSGTEQYACPAHDPWQKPQTAAASTTGWTYRPLCGVSVTAAAYPLSPGGRRDA